MAGWAELFIFLFGLVFLTKCIAAYYFFAIHFINIFILARLFKRDLVSRYGQWALITGGTSGIGLSLSLELAANGFDIILVSRSKERLLETASEIENKFKRKTFIVVADALNRSSVNIIADTVKDLDIGILVNNVGLNTKSGCDDILEIKQSDILNLINVNAGYLAALTVSVFQPMVAKGRGLIVNIGSTSGFCFVPNQNIYTSTKCFTRILSLCMNKELKGVEVCYLYPQFVRTRMTQHIKMIHNSPLWTQSPSNYARFAVTLLGMTNESSGHWVFEFVPHLFNCQLVKGWYGAPIAALIRKLKALEDVKRTS